MNSKHQAILWKVFENPPRADLAWRDLDKLLLALGAELSEGSGSRVRVFLNRCRAVFHRPHPTPHTHKGALKSLRKFLETAGVKLEKKK